MMNKSTRYPLLENKLFICLLSFLLFFVNFTYAFENESVYSVDVTIPDYDPDNSEHFLISEKADWAHINDTDIRFFYVEPNSNYGYVYIATDGTEIAKRYISLYNGNDTHPAKLPIEEQANVQLDFNNAKYWVVDRMSSINRATDGYCFTVRGASTNVVLNRLNISNFYGGVIIQGTLSPPHTNNITVQNSRFDPMSSEGLDSDRVAIALTGEDWNVSRTLMNTKILNNEIKNCNDGIQPITRVEISGFVSDYPGTIIDCNHIYIDNTIYSDGNGNHDPTGLYAWAENAIDLKAGSSDPDNPMIITNNHFWGFRWTDADGGGSGDAGIALIGHYHVKNVIIENNVIFDSNRAIAFAASGGLPYSVENASISDNIIYNIGHSPTGITEYGQYFYNSKNLSYERNTIVGVNKQSKWLVNNNDEVDMSVSCNVLIDSYEMTGTRSSSTSVENNTYYNTGLQYSGDGVFYANTADANMADLIFTTDTYTNSPRDIMLPGVVPTETSPHATGCFANLKPAQASGPIPSNGVCDIHELSDLSWTTDSKASSHDVYFGTNNPPPFALNQAEESFTIDTELDAGTVYYWRIDEKNDEGITKGAVWSFATSDIDVGMNVINSKITIPPVFSIACYPNPSFSFTNIQFNIPRNGHVIIKIFNLMGEVIEKLVDSDYTEGTHEVVWNFSNNSEGNYEGRHLYMYRVQFEDQIKNGKILIFE